jgi:membrane associated rhomboid family serine protease
MNYRPSGFSFLPPVVKNLLIINGLSFFASIVFGRMGFDVLGKFGLYLPVSEFFEPYQLVTHLFLHDTSNLGHILGNMFALWMFGTPLENLWGGKRFFIYYFVTGFGAAALHLGVNYWDYLQASNLHLLEGSLDALYRMQSLAMTPTVGASGAVFGLLLGYGMMFPNQQIYLYFLLPIKAKWFVLIYGLFELFNGVANSGSSIAHFAHVGGMIFGFLLIRRWQANRREF